MPSSSNGSMSDGWPARCTGTIAFVLRVTSAATCSGSMFRSESRTSAKTGFAPVWTITFAVAGHVIGVVITSSPGPVPRATSERWSAAVPDATASTCSACRYAAMRSSRSAAFGPVVSQPERSVSATAAISSSPSAGGWKPSWVSRVIDEEAYCRRRTAGPLEGVVAAFPRREDRARAVGAVPELADDVAGLPVEAHLVHAVRGARLLDSLDGDEATGRRHEEEDARAADQTLCCFNTSVTPQREVEREVVQPHAGRELAQLGVVAAAEARRQLDHARPVGGEAKLRIRRPVADPKRFRGR